MSDEHESTDHLAAGIDVIREAISGGGRVRVGITEEQRAAVLAEVHRVSHLVGVDRPDGWDHETTMKIKTLAEGGELPPQTA